MNNFIEYQNSKFFYRKSGNGPKTLLLFHGFGQNHQVFTSWDESLSQVYTLYAFDIFFHGQSEWSSNDRAMEKADWKEIMQTFFKTTHLQRFSLAGFSMGGKFVLATLEAFPGKVDEIFLLAPDGIKTNFWYSLATYPIAFRNLFKSMIEKPNRFYAIARFANKVGMIDKGILKFVESQMDTREKRQRVYFSWVIFRHLKFDMLVIANTINQNNIHVTMLVGKYDKIITTQNMIVLLNKLTSYDLKILETGHNGIIAESVVHMKPSD